MLARLDLCNSAYGRSTFVIHCDNAGTCGSFRKGSITCPYSWTIIKALVIVARGTMSLVSVTKTWRCSKLGETIADTIAGIGEITADMIAKGCIENLSRTDIPTPTWLRLSRVLLDWIKKPTVTSSLGHDLLREISFIMDVVIPTTCLEAIETDSEGKLQN